VDKTILKSRLAVAARRDFPDVKFRVAAHIRYRRKQSGSGIRTIIGSGSTVNQLVHVPTSVDMQHFIQIHARVLSNLANRQTNRQTYKHGQKHVPPTLSEVITASTLVPRHANESALPGGKGAYRLAPACLIGCAAYYATSY